MPGWIMKSTSSPLATSCIARLFHWVVRVRRVLAFNGASLGIPAAHTDFIFAVFGSTFGFFGSVYLILLCLALDVKLIMIAYRSRNDVGPICFGGNCRDFYLSTDSKHRYDDWAFTNYGYYSATHLLWGIVLTVLHDWT